MQNTKTASRQRARLGPTGRAVAANVRNLRIERGLTLQQVSDLSKESPTPLSLDALSKLENGLRRVDVDDLAVLCAILQTSPQELMHGSRETRSLGRLRELSAKDGELCVLEDYVQQRRALLDRQIEEEEREFSTEHAQEINFSKWSAAVVDRPRPEPEVGDP